MRGLMMETPLLLREILWSAEHVGAEKRVITRRAAGCHSLSYGELVLRVRRLCNGLAALGVMPGDRVGLIAWNTHQAMEVSFAVPVCGAVLHGINLRMGREQIVQTMRHAGDRVVFADPDQLVLVAEMLPELPAVEALILMGEAETEMDVGVPVLAYERLLAGHEPLSAFPDLDENEACALYYTGGTTGDPKGVLFSHRGTVLQTLGMCLHGTIGIKEADVLLAIAPMFHLNAWGIPYAAALQGATLVLPGTHPSAEDCVALLENQRITLAAGATSVGILLQDHIEHAGREFDLDALEVLWLGGQAPPRSLMEWWADRFGTEVVQGWGMTETTSMVAFTHLKAKFRDAPRDELYAARAKQGLPLPLCQWRIVDEVGRELPWDGASAGELLVRGPWIASAYFEDDRNAHDAGWLQTGDLATIDGDCQLHLVDRLRDVVKSGGEWISTLDLESRLTIHPSVRDAAVVAVADAKWIERPVAFIVADGSIDERELRDHIGAAYPRFWIPDRFIIVAELPRTSIGKTDKARLREWVSAETAPDPIGEPA